MLPLWRKEGHSLIFKLDYKGSGRMILILLFSLVAVKNQCFPSSLLRNPDESLPGLVMTLYHLRRTWISLIPSVKSQSQPWRCNAESWSLRERRALNSQLAASTGNGSCLRFINSPPRTPITNNNACGGAFVFSQNRSNNVTNRELGRFLDTVTHAPSVSPSYF